RDLGKQLGLLSSIAKLSVIAVRLFERSTPLTLRGRRTLGGFVQRGRTASRAVGSREAFFGKGHRETEQVYPPIPWDRRSFCHVRAWIFDYPSRGEGCEYPKGFFTLYEEHLMRARLWFPIQSVIVVFLNLLEVSISQTSPRGINHLVGLL
ncbi:unnamed protein product, partial [Brassica napus]